jgi:ATP-dependent Lon protease
LTGQVLPVGGIKEKVLAAKAAGITRIFLPDRNEADVDEIRDEDVLKGLQFVYVDHVTTVLEQVLANKRTSRTQKRNAASRGTAGAVKKVEGNGGSTQTQD